MQTVQICFQNQLCTMEESMKVQINLNYIGGLLNMSRDMSFPTMLYVRPAKAQTSLRIRAV